MAKSRKRQTEGRAEMTCTLEDKVLELRADANALDRSAHLIEEVPTGLPAIERSMAATMLQAMAGGIRFAVNRMTDNGIPF
jgi:hypothetical protein